MQANGEGIIGDSISLVFLPDTTCKLHDTQSRASSSKRRNKRGDVGDYKHVEETDLKSLRILDQAGRKDIEDRVEVHILQSLHIKHLIAGCKEACNEDAKEASQTEDPGIPPLCSKALLLVRRGEFVKFLRRHDADLFGCGRRLPRMLRC